MNYTSKDYTKKELKEIIELHLEDARLAYKRQDYISYKRQDYTSYDESMAKAEKFKSMLLEK